MKKLLALLLSAFLLTTTGCLDDEDKELRNLRLVLK